MHAVLMLSILGSMLSAKIHLWPV